MKIPEYINLIKEKIDIAHQKAKNPFMDRDIFDKTMGRTSDTYEKPLYTTIVWVEQPEEKNIFKY